MNWLIEYWNTVITLFTDMAIYLLAGFLIAGILHVYFSSAFINGYLGKNNFMSVLYASLIGIPLPLCSCGVIPTGISLYRNGASKGASVSFLISTPQTGVDSILITYGMIGLPFALLRPIIAFITGIIGGLIVNKTDKTGINTASVNDDCEIAPPIKNKILKMLHYAFITFLQDIQLWLVMGILLAGLISVLIPDNFFVTHIPNNFTGMLLILLFSLPLYVCATSSVPIALVLMMKGLSPGAALVFLMAGPATNIATMLLIGRSMGIKTLFSYVFSIIGGAILFGLSIDYFLPADWFTIRHQHQHIHNSFFPVWLMAGSAIILASLLIYGFYSTYRNPVLSIFKRKKNNIMDKNTMIIKVTGMTCNHCRENVEMSILSVEGITMVQANHTTGEVIISGKDIHEVKQIEAIKQAIEKAGYKFVN